MPVATCAGCGRHHTITQNLFAMFGVDCLCLRCVDWKHVKFMKTNKAGIKSCVKGCRCGFGSKG
jgi:hypothetical protein